MRRNGCFRQDGRASLNAFQVAITVLFGGLLAGFFAVFAPLVRHSALRTAALLGYALLALLVFVLAVVCTLTDPIERNLRRKLQFHKEGREWSDTLHSQVEDEPFFCALCEVSVKATAKHCRACDKCVEGFDHHCKWLNNCVAARNYRSFFWLVATTSVLVAVHLGVCSALFVYCFVDKEGMRQQLRRQLVQDGLFHFKVDWSTFLGLAVAYGVVLLVALALLGELLVFHVLLGYKGMSTYDYIVAERRRKEELLERKLDSQAAPAAAAAAGQGKLRCLQPAALPCSRGAVAPARDGSPQGGSRGARHKVSLNLCSLLATPKPLAPPPLAHHRAPLQSPLGAGGARPELPPTPPPEGVDVRSSTRYVSDAPADQLDGSARERGARAVLLVDEDSEARAFPMVDSPMNSPSKRGLFNPQSNPLRSLAARPLSMEPAAHDSV